MTDHDHHDHNHSELSETELRVRALETILTEKGYVDPTALDLLIETYETKVGPRNGARVVAHFHLEIDECDAALLEQPTTWVTLQTGGMGNRFLVSFRSACCCCFAACGPCGQRVFALSTSP